MDVDTTWKRLVGRSVTSDGFTIAELLMAVTILFIVLMGVLGAVEFAAGSTRQASMREGAVQLANQKLEYARNIPYTALGTKNSDGTFGDPAGVLPTSESVTTTTGVYTVSYQVTWVRKSDSDPTGRTVMYKSIRVTVSWTTPKASSVSVETAIYGIDTNSVVGDVQLFAQDADTLNPVQGVSCMLDPASGPNRTVATGSDGNALFGQVQYGQLTTMTATKAGYMADYYTFGTKTVSPNIVNVWTIIMQQPKYARIQVVGKLGGAISGASVTLVNKDPRGGSYGPLTSDSSGYVTFGNLWKTSSVGYVATATYNGNSASSTAFSVGASNNSGNPANATVTINDQAQITVTVKDNRTSSALQGATVTMTGPVNPADDGSTTKSDGTKSFTVTRSGTYAITISKTGYVAQTINWYVDLNNPSNPPTVNLVPVVKLIITITDKWSTSAVPGQTVTVKDSANNVDGTGTTDSNGQVSIDITTTDTYTITTSDGTNVYQNSSGTQSVNMSGSSTVNYAASLYTGRIKVQVYKNSSGSTLPTNPSGFVINVYKGGTTTPVLYSGTTDSTGSWTSPAMVAGQNYYVKVTTHDAYTFTVPNTTGTSVPTGASTPVGFTCYIGTTHN